MLVIVSDLHLSDGSTASNVHPTAFELLGEEVKAAADRKGAQEIHVVLLGDILDLVRTDWWHRQGIPAGRRPWGGELDPETAMNSDSAEVERQYRAVLDGTLASAAGKALFKMISELRAPGGPPVRATYVVGNHDRVLNNFDGLRTHLQSALPGVPLAFDTKLGAPAYGVLARHGHEWDDHCHGWIFMTKVLKRNRKASRFDPAAYRVMAIGEVVTAELMSGLVYHVAQGLDLTKAEEAAFLELVKDVNNLRPMTDVLKWLGWATRGQVKRYVAIAEEAVNQALDGLLDNSFAKRWDAIKPDLVFWGDLTDWLKRVRAVIKKDGLLSLHRDASTLARLAERASAVYRAVAGKGSHDRYVTGAAEEFDGADPSVRFIVYGHTHRALRRCVAGDLEHRARLYVNTGTYLPLIERAEDGRSFWRAHRMAVLLVFRDDEDAEGRWGPGPTLDVWDGVRLKQYQNS